MDEATNAASPREGSPAGDPAEGVSRDPPGPAPIRRDGGGTGRGPILGVASPDRGGGVDDSLSRTRRPTQ